MLDGFVNKTDTMMQGPCETKGYYDVINQFLVDIDASILTRDVEITIASWLKIGGCL